MMHGIAVALLAVTLFQADPPPNLTLPVTVFAIPDTPLPIPVSDFVAAMNQEWTTGLESVTFQHTDDFEAQSSAILDAVDGAIAAETDMADNITTLTADAPDVASGIDSSTGLSPIAGSGPMSVRAMIEPMAESVAVPFTYGKGGVVVVQSLASGFPSFIAVAVLFVGMWVCIGYMIFVRIVMFVIASLGLIVRAVLTIKGLIPFVG